MRNRMLVSVGAGMLTVPTFWGATWAQALQAAARYGITPEVHGSGISRNVGYVCRRDAYGRTCTYVWRSDRPDQPHTSSYWSNVSRYQSQGSGYYPYGTGYFPWYWGRGVK